MPGRLHKARVYGEKWNHFNRNSLPWNRLAIHREMMARDAFVRWPMEGNVLEAFRKGWIELGPHVHFEPHVWIDVLGGRLRIGEYTKLTLGVMIVANNRVEIGKHCGIGAGSFISDADHRFDDPAKPVTWQGFTSKGPTRIGDNCWLGANVVVTSGVTIGERCVIGANSVVTRDIPPRSIAAGSPAKVIREIEFARDSG
jgi:acetyltransferase-like isoleucine patch superfamily enzyme